MKTLITITIILFSLNCDRHKDQSINPEQQNLVLSYENVFTNEGKLIINNIAKNSLYDNDPEYHTLLIECQNFNMSKTFNNQFQGDIDLIAKYSPAYKSAIESRSFKIKNLLEVKTANLEDSMRKSIESNYKAELESQFPLIGINNYANEARNNFQKALNDFNNKHINDFYVVGTYDGYIPTEERAMFEIEKFRPARLWRRFEKKYYPFAEPIADRQEMNRFISSIDDYDPISLESGRWKKDLPPDNLSERTYKVKIPLEAMNNTLKAVDKRHESLINQLYQKELTFGSATYLLGRGFNDQYLKTYYYSDEKERTALMKRVRSFVRRVSIMLLAKGDPFEMNHKECHLVVLGVDNSFYRVL
ncbi:MAG TPA: hypothetical protein VGK03_11985 [Geothrix sp.]|jgi:hypothetical protein